MCYYRSVLNDTNQQKVTSPKERFMYQKLYATKKELYDSCMKSEAGITVIATPVYNQYGELLGYRKYWVD